MTELCRRNARKRKTKCCKSKKHNRIDEEEERIKENYNKLQELFTSQYVDPYDINGIPFSQSICYEPATICAEKITDLTILLAKSLLTGTRPESQPEFEKIKPVESIWPQVGQLNMISGLRAVDIYLSTLDYDPTLKYCVDFIMQSVDRVASTFVYEVKWSIPTKEEPVQLSTANMYFKLKSYYSHPADCPIEVTYTYENSNLILNPDEVKFKESWILNIMESKTEFRTKNGFSIETFI